jgi:phosphoribosylaminoimidazole-succinocarboxamide synthase
MFSPSLDLEPTLGAEARFLFQAPFSTADFRTRRSTMSDVPIIPNVPMRRGKVRDVYDLGDRLVLVASDRISAFDYILPTRIPDKGKILTAMTLFWLEHLGVENHLLATDVTKMPEPFCEHSTALQGRTCLVKKTKVVPIECVVRGYILGTAWGEYQRTGSVCGIALPAGLRQAEKLPQPIFTPATKEESGHDVNITFAEMSQRVGKDLAEELQQRSLEIYRRAADHAAKGGILLADTKFEWGKTPEGKLILIDEVLTPDSSRFWAVEEYVVGKSPPSFDKQFLRDWLEGTTWDKNSPPPELPTDIVEKTREKYAEAYRRVTGKKFGE